MYAIVFNYNLPNETTHIYEKLVFDGFNKNKILIVDNGSDKQPAASCTNFSLPVNVRFTGQAFMAISYLLNFFQFDHLLLITTSAGFLEERNYVKDLEKVIEHSKNHKAGFITSSLIGGSTELNAPDQNHALINKDFTNVYKYQPIATVISRQLLVLCQKSSSAYFNLSLKRGWGIDRELQYIANINKMPCYVSKDFVVEWKTNLAHRKKLADESLENYHSEAKIEMIQVLEKKYGRSWKKKFKSAFSKTNDKSSLIEKTFIYFNK